MTKSKFLKIKKNSQKFKFQNFRNLTSAIDAQWFEVPLTRIPGESVDKQKNYREDWEESGGGGEEGEENPLYEVARHLKTRDLSIEIASLGGPRVKINRNHENASNSTT